MNIEAHVKICKCDPEKFPLNLRKELSLLGDVGMDGWWDWHIKEDWEYMSHGFWETLKYDPKDKSHHPSEWQKIIVEEHLNIVYKNYNEHVNSKGVLPFDQDVQYLCGDGSLKWIRCCGKVIEWDENFEPVRMIGTHKDIDEFKKTKLKVESEHLKFKNVFNTVLAPMILFNEKGIIIDVNNSFLLEFKKEKDKFVGFSYKDITYEEDLDQDALIEKDFLEKKITFARWEKRFINENKPVWYSIGANSIYEDGNLKGYVVELHNINEKKKKQKNIIENIQLMRSFIKER
jgi:PAS domain S-box-containing protein